MDRAEILNYLKKYKKKYSKKYGIIRLGLFGSYALDMNTPSSDIDIVVDIKSADMFILIHIKDELELFFKKKVDIIRNRDTMNPYLKKQIENKAIYV